MAKKPVNYEALLKWLNESGVVDLGTMREKIKSYGHKSPNSAIESLKCDHNAISIRKMDSDSKYWIHFTVDEELSKESSSWIEHVYGPTKDISSMVSTLERHGYKEKKASYSGHPRTYAVFDCGVLGQKVNWCEPCGRNDQHNLPESGTEEELTGCEDSIQQEETSQRGNASPIKKLSACIEAQYARDLKTMGKERADWWKA